MATSVTAVTAGNSITITKTTTSYGITTPTKVVRRKNQCYVNLTGTGLAQTFAIIDHTGSTIFSKAFNSSGTQDSATHTFNGDATLALFCSGFNTWNGGGGVAATTSIQLGVTGTTLQLMTSTSGTAAGSLLTSTPIEVRVQH